MRHFRRGVLVIAFAAISSFSLWAHEGGSSEHHVEGKSSPFSAAIELRPSWEAGSGNMFGENTVELGYQVSEKFALGYQQEIHHNISIKEGNPEHEGLGLHLEEGYFNAHLHEIWESEDEKSVVSLEPRLIMPTSNEDREKGFRTAALSYLKFRRRLGENTSVTMMDAPVLFVYSVPGATVGDEFEANPTFQNRFRASADFSFFENKVNVTLPVLFYLTRHANYAPGALHNDVWTKFVGVAPEISYAFTPNLSAGLAVVSPNLLNAQDTDHSVNHGRTSTVSQMILRAQL